MLWMVRGIGAATVTGFLGPALASLFSPVLRSDGEASMWRPVGPVEGFGEQKMHKAVIAGSRDRWRRTREPQGVFVWRNGDGEFVVFSRSCTDLGCPVTWDGGSGWFLCPCHGGIFNREGEPVAGPPARPLYRYASRVREGVLEVDVRSVPPMF